jgi:hypothetical protein
VGVVDGSLVGRVVGRVVGAGVGAHEGMPEGAKVGRVDGGRVGEAVGRAAYQIRVSSAFCLLLGEASQSTTKQVKLQLAREDRLMYALKLPVGAGEGLVVGGCVGT